jgi:steroid 5-alpha reductase family enzyme
MPQPCLFNLLLPALANRGAQSAAEIDPKIDTYRTHVVSRPPFSTSDGVIGVNRGRSGWRAYNESGAPIAVRKLQHSLYETGQSPGVERFVFAALAGAWVGLAWYLLLGGGLAKAGGWFSQDWAAGDPTRRICLAVAFSIYYVRILFTVFVFQKQRMGWGSVFGITTWILCIYVFLAILAGVTHRSLGYTGVAGLLLFLAGCWMNSHAEYTRDVWKQLPQNHGRFYPGGLFRYTRHPNYLGDLLSFSGLCLISGSWISILIPLLMLAGFVFVNIPRLDSHLHAHYGAEFDQYASHTPKLIPFVY